MKSWFPKKRQSVSIGGIKMIPNIKSIDPSMIPLHLDLIRGHHPPPHLLLSLAHTKSQRVIEETGEKRVVERLRETNKNKSKDIIAGQRVHVEEILDRKNHFECRKRLIITIKMGIKVHIKVKVLRAKLELIKI